MKKANKKKVAVKKKPATKKVKKSKPAKKSSAKKPIKKLSKKKFVGVSAKPKPEEGKRVGKITHYFDKIKVVVVKLSDGVGVGETIRIKGGQETDFKQKIVSMEIDGQKVKKAKKGQQIGIKVKEKAREGYQVFKIYPIK